MNYTYYHRSHYRRSNTVSGRTVCHTRYQSGSNLCTGLNHLCQLLCICQSRYGSGIHYLGNIRSSLYRVDRLVHAVENTRQTGSEKRYCFLGRPQCRGQRKGRRYRYQHHPPGTNRLCKNQRKHRGGEVDRWLPQRKDADYRKPYHRRYNYG